MSERFARVRTSWFLGVLSVALAASFAFAVLPGAAQSAPRPISEITPDDLITATLRPSDLKQIVPETEAWWQKFPEFNLSASPLPGERFFVAQNYSQVGGDENLEIRSGLVLFESAEAAKAGLGELRSTDDADGTFVEGPVVGEESYFFRRSTEDDPFETTLRFRVGPVIGRISTFSQSDFGPQSQLVVLANPVLTHVGSVLEGTRMAIPLSPTVTAWFPPLAASANIGPVIGSAVVPAEAWALIDSEDNPPSTLERLHRLGAVELPYRSYEFVGHPGHSVDVTVFPFNDEQAAIAWVAELDETIAADERLSAGQLGQHAAYLFGGDYYELQFAKGRFAVDLACYAAEDEVSPDCETALRDLAEQWYASMSGT